MARKRRCEPLDTYCKLHQISATGLAERLGVPHPTARSWINGQRAVSAKRAVEIEKKIGIPRETLRPDLFVRRAA